MHIYNDDFTVLKFDMSFVVKKKGTVNNNYQKKGTNNFYLIVFIIYFGNKIAIKLDVVSYEIKLETLFSSKVDVI